MSEEVIFKALSSGTSAIAYTEDVGKSVTVNGPPRLGRSKIFAREELMYAKSPPASQQNQFHVNVNPAYRGPLPRNVGTRGSNAAEKSTVNERLENPQRRLKTVGTRRISTKDSADVEDDNPLQRYETALLRYRKSAQGGVGGLRKDRKESRFNIGNNGYSSSDDSEGVSPRYNKSKSTSSIDTQSVNNILDEYEDLDCRRSSDLSESGSVNMTSYEAVMDQRKRHQQQKQQQHDHQVERSKEATAREEVSAECEGQAHHEQRVKNMVERSDTVFKVNQQTQVRQRSRERQKLDSTMNSAISGTREASNKLNSRSEDLGKMRQDASSGTTSENLPSENRTSVKQAPEVLLRKGEVQKRVDEWLNQTQAQNFSAANIGKRESGRIVALVRSSSSAESKNLRRSKNDTRSRSTDENTGERLNGTTSYDDINRTETSKMERKLERTKNVTSAISTRGTYKDYLAGRNRSKHSTDYGFAGQRSNVKPSDSNLGGSRIPQRGPMNSRRRESSNDRTMADSRATNETASETINAVPVTTKQEKNSSRGSRLVAAEAGNIDDGFVKTRPEQVSNNGAASVSTAVLANGRAASFKRARSHEQNNAIATGRNTSASGKEGPQSFTSNSVMRSGSQQHQHHHQSVSKGQSVEMDQQQKEQNGMTSPNKDGESRRTLVAGRETRTREEPIEQVCKPADESIKAQQKQQQFSETNEKKKDVLVSQKQETNVAKFPDHPTCEVDQNERENLMEKPATSTNEASFYSAERSAHHSPDESKTPGLRLVRENSNGVEPKRPPAPPRRDQSRRDKVESMPINERPTADQPCSSFRPNKRIYSALRQSNEQSPFVTSVDSRGSSYGSSPVKSHYAAPKQVETIYERSLQPQVIHSNDLESILKPVGRASAYGESAESESPRNMEKSSRLSDNTKLDEIADVFLDNAETAEINRRSESPISARYPEIGLDQCLKVQRRHPTTKSTCKESSMEKKSFPIINAKCWDQEMVIEPAKTFGTFQPVNVIQCSNRSLEKSNRKDAGDAIPDTDDNKIVDDTKEPSYQEPDLIPKLKVSIADSYEARSTLRLDRNLTGGKSRDSELRNKSEEKQYCHDTGSEDSHTVPKSKPSDLEEKRAVIQDNHSSEHGAIVNEVLVKNLRFQQDLPNADVQPRVIAPIIAPKPFNFNSVLSDDYEKIQADDSAAKRDKDSKIYVTKEEMERQRLMDFLKRGDFESVKLVSATRIR